MYPKSISGKLYLWLWSRKKRKQGDPLAGKEEPKSLAKS